PGAHVGPAGRPPRALPPRARPPPRGRARGRRARAGAPSPVARGRAWPGSPGRAPPACGNSRSPPRRASCRSSARRARTRRSPGAARARRAAPGAPPWSVPSPARSLRLLDLVVDDLVVGVLDDLVVGSRRAVAAAVTRLGGRGLGLAGLRVDRLGELVRGLLERLGLGADVGDVAA